MRYGIISNTCVTYSKATPSSYNARRSHKSLYASLNHSYPGNCPVTKEVIKQLNTCVAEQTAAFLSLFIPPLSASHQNDRFERDRMQKSIFILVWILSPAAAAPAQPVHQIRSSPVLTLPRLLGPVSGP